MGAYGNTKEECEAKINSYKNPDPRCTYPFTCDPLGYCWSFALHIDGNENYKNMEEHCKHCECWSESEEYKKEQEKMRDIIERKKKDE